MSSTLPSGKTRYGSGDVARAVASGLTAVRAQGEALEGSGKAFDRHGFAKALIATARRTEISAYVGDGANRWSAAHTRDTARLLELALDRAPAGARLHSVGEEGLAIKTIATTIGEHLGLPAIGISPDQAVDHFGFGFLAGQLQTNAPASNALTRGMVGWEPTEHGLLSDLRDDRYYEA